MPPRTEVNRRCHSKIIAIRESSLKRRSLKGDGAEAAPKTSLSFKNTREFVLRDPRRGASGDRTDGQRPSSASPRSAVQFALSHVCRLITYPLAGFDGWARDDSVHARCGVVGWRRLGGQAVACCGSERRPARSSGYFSRPSALAGRHGRARSRHRLRRPSYKAALKGLASRLELSFNKSSSCRGSLSGLTPPPAGVLFGARGLRSPREATCPSIAS